MVDLLCEADGLHPADRRHQPAMPASAPAIDARLMVAGADHPALMLTA